MVVADIFAWFASESIQAAERTTGQQREAFLKLASLWTAAALQCRNEAATPQPIENALSKPGGANVGPAGGARAE
jgi:hypothetical protein